MNRNFETYDELIRQKRCIELTKYYELTEDDLNKIYDFLEKNKDGKIVGGTSSLSFKVGNTISSVLACKCISSAIASVLVTNSLFRVIPYHTPSSSSSFSSSSSNNNNNNNNHNNNNNNR